MKQPANKVTPLSTATGWSMRKVQVNQVVPSTGIAIVSDKTGYVGQIPYRVQRAKGRMPQVGDVWYIDRALGDWSFAAYVAPDDATMTYSTFDSLTVTNDLTVSGDITVGGNLTVSGVGQRRRFTKILDQGSTVTTMADVIDLGFSVVANATYEVRARIAYDGPVGADIQMSWTVPSSTTMSRNILAPAASISTNIDTTMMALRHSAGTARVAGTPGSVINTATGWWEDAVVTVGSTPGIVQLRFAQASASGTSYIRSLSYLIVTRDA